MSYLSRILRRPIIGLAFQSRLVSTTATAINVAPDLDEGFLLPQKRISVDIEEEPVRPEINLKSVLTERFIRADHAGEFIATRIYAGQHFFLQNTPLSHTVREIMQREMKHMSIFESLMERHATQPKPTFLMDFYNIVGLALGASIASSGQKGSTTLTVIVEEIASQHYKNQIRTLTKVDPTETEFLKLLKHLRDEELRDLQTGHSHKGEQGPLYEGLREVLVPLAKLATWISERF